MLSLCTQRTLRRVVSSRTHVCPSCVRYSSTASKPSRTIFSGIQPTGVPHLGNYLGALREWVKLQDEARDDDVLLFSIVDLHAITVKQDPAQLMRSKSEMFVSLLAIGLDPNKSIIFEQSRVPAHAELMWILSCNASMGYLGRMTQWKSKLVLPENASPLDPSPSNKAALKLGLFSYPVLQAADILLYGTTHVPVGEDQAQHLEFARDLAVGFNHVFAPGPGNPVLTPPQTIISPAKRIMSLTDPTKKMSKSDPDPRSRILITDSREEIKKKINGAKTDSLPGISYDRKIRPGVSNLIDILYYMSNDTGVSPEYIASEMSGADMSMKALKAKVADAIDEGLRDVRDKYEDVMRMPIREVNDMRNTGKTRATIQAVPIMNRIHLAMGL